MPRNPTGGTWVPWADIGEKRERQAVERTIRSIDHMDAYREVASGGNVDKFPFIPEPPCTTCPSFRVCRDYKLACKAFCLYVAEPGQTRIKGMEFKWTKITDLSLLRPNKRLYERLFGKEKALIPTQPQPSDSE